MDNHYHLLLETPEGNLSQGMRHLNGVASVEDWLNTTWVLSAFDEKKSRAICKFIDFVSRAKGQPSIWNVPKNQIYLGDDKFVEDMQCKISADTNLDEVPRPQKRQPPKPIETYEDMMLSRNEAIVLAYHSGGFSMTEIAAYFGIHYSSVSKIIKLVGDSQFKT